MGKEMLGGRRVHAWLFQAHSQHAGSCGVCLIAAVFSLMLAQLSQTWTR